jgi:hypothetical protein
MNKHDIKRNLPILTGKLSQYGYDRWWHTFTGVHSKSRKRKTFFVEYCIVNPALGTKLPIMGDNQYQLPAYLMVKAGYFGKDGKQLKRFFGIEEMEVAGTFLKLTAGECFLSENNIWGRISGDSNIMWSLHMDKRIAFHVGYSAGKPVREINPFDMYWHAEGMRTSFEGTVSIDGESYEVAPKYGYGYSDKKWGRNYTHPWFWLNGNQMKSSKTGENLERSAFAMGGGDPVFLGLQLKNKPFADIYYEGESHEINYATPWTSARMKYACSRRDGKMLWHMKGMDLSTAMEIKVVCPEIKMLKMDYQTPDGTWNSGQMLTGANGKGEITLYRRKGRKLTLVDQIWVKNVGCEFNGIE